MIIFILSGSLIYYLISFINTSTIIGWIIAAIIAIVIHNLIIYILFRKSEEFNYFYDKGINIINRFLKNGAKS